MEKNSHEGFAVFAFTLHILHGTNNCEIIPQCPVCRWRCGLWLPNSLTSHISEATQRHDGAGRHHPAALNPQSRPPGMHYSERKKERERVGMEGRP